jgi:hypothetical protein
MRRGEAPIPHMGGKVFTWLMALAASLRKNRGSGPLARDIS